MVGKKAPYAASSGGARAAVAILPRQPTSLGEPFLGVFSFTRRESAPAPAQPPPERQMMMRRRLVALGGGLVVLVLIVLGVKGCLDARAAARSPTTRGTSNRSSTRRPRPANASSKSWKTRGPVGDRIHRRGRGRPQRDGQLRLADRRDRRPGRDEQRPEVTRTRLHAALGGDGHDRRENADRAGEQGAAKATAAIARQWRSCSPPT